MQRSFVRRLPAHGVLRMDGREALDLLHRLSTNAVSDMQPGDAHETVLTTEKARIIDCVLVLARADHVLLLVSPDRMATLRAWLEKYTIMEDIRYTDCSATTMQAEVSDLGEEDVQALFDDPLPAVWQAREQRIGGSVATLIRHDSIQGPGWRLLFTVPENAPTQPEHSLDAWLSEKKVQHCSTEDYTLWRVRRGHPAIGAELTDRVNPLEAGAEAAVSFTKGCYIGQEVIARLDSQDKVQRRLRRLRIDAPDGTEGFSGAELLLADADAGFIGSAVFDASAASFAALGCVRTAFLEEGTVLSARTGEQVFRVTVLADHHER
ncbi:MAG: hypothetical protein IPP94_18405 [Ignavibacteria bacterium]|nr:hypothetical protein [Ignavibacteria bacterium]